MAGKRRRMRLDFSSFSTNALQVAKNVSRSANRFFHIHLVSDASGETLNRVVKAVTANYASHQPIEHQHAMVRSSEELETAIHKIEEEPGITLYTLADEEMKQRLERACADLGLPCISILDPATEALAKYLNTEKNPRVGGQHTLNETYFSRIMALDYAMVHDDGQHPETLKNADIVLLGISRTSKTPTSIYLANRGLRTANIPFVSGRPLPEELFELEKSLIVGLVANAAVISDIRRKRLDILRDDGNEDYVDRHQIAQETIELKTLCARQGWPVIDVSRRSIEETAALILNLMEERARQA